MIVFITGGSMSSLGKGIVASSLGALLVARGLKIRLRKFDPYLNVDPGTMSPYQHGEVFVTEDGTETDLDLGSYERFTGVNAERTDSTTAGRLYLNVIEKERRGDYLGKTVQIIPHITDEIKQAILHGIDEVDVMICEIGGTVGDIESLPFVEALRQIRHTHRALYMHLSWVPYVEVAGEVKTKLIQHSVKELQRCGIQPDVLVCRSDRAIPREAMEKISLFCNVELSNVIEAQNVQTIYETPLAYHKAGLDEAVCRHFGLETPPPCLQAWQKISATQAQLSGRVSIGVVGKYIRFPDTYRSLIEALVHGGWANQVQADIHLIDAEDLEHGEKIEEKLGHLHGLVVPGGFGPRGIEGMIKTITYARTKEIPFFGICFGLQLAVIETARSLLGLSQAGSSEFGPTPDPVVALLKEWVSKDQLYLYKEELGGTMRLGANPCLLKQGSKIHKIYGQDVISERHRHRYEVNGAYLSQLEEAGLMISGTNQEGLVECVERPDHPWFIAAQFHPEFKSRPFSPHPLFISFIQEACAISLNKRSERSRARELAGA